MRRSAYRRTAAPTSGNRRLLAGGAVIAALGLAVGVTTISSAAENDKPAGSGAGKVVNGQVILTDTCVDSNLQGHDGFQKGDRCVSTEFGEVSSAANNSSLLITQSPSTVNVNTPFTLKVSTRNLIRDRFLAAGAGGYYVESSVLQGGIERGHFHTACRMLTSTREAPDPAPVPAFFVATEDKKGGKAPDTVTIQVPGLPQEGTAQCASWAGDGSHRVPMMERANETPAIDAVRIRVTANGGGNNGGGNNGGNNGGQQGGNNGGQNGGGQNGGQQGGNNGGQQGGNNGGQTGNGGNNGGGQNNGGQNGGNNNGGNNNGGNNNGGAATTAPTPAGTAAQPDTKSDFTPKATITTTKPPSTPKSEPTEKSTSKPASTRTQESSESDSAENDPVETAKPKASKSTEAAAAGDYTYSNDDGQLNSGEKPPTIDQVAAQTTTEQKKGGILALTGTNTVAFLGGAVVMMLAGLSLMALTRRRRPGTPWQ